MKHHPVKMLLVFAAMMSALVLMWPGQSDAGSGARYERARTSNGQTGYRGSSRGTYSRNHYGYRHGGDYSRHYGRYDGGYRRGGRCWQNSCYGRPYVSYYGAPYYPAYYGAYYDYGYAPYWTYPYDYYAPGVSFYFGF